MTKRQEKRIRQGTLIPLYPHVVVELSGTDGNAFAVMGAVSGAMKRAGVPQVERERFVEEARRGNYDELLQTCMRYVEVR